MIQPLQDETKELFPTPGVLTSSGNAGMEKANLHKKCHQNETLKTPFKGIKDPHALKIENRISSSLTLESESENQNKGSAVVAASVPSFPIFGVTEWTSAQEQRKPNERDKRGHVIKTSDHNEDSVPPANSQITLEFLNNSLNEAMMDIEKIQKDSPLLSSEGGFCGELDAFNDNLIPTKDTFFEDNVLINKEIHHDNSHNNLLKTENMGGFDIVIEGENQGVSSGSQFKENFSNEGLNDVDEVLTDKESVEEESPVDQITIHLEDLIEVEQQDSKEMEHNLISSSSPPCVSTLEHFSEDSSQTEDGYCSVGLESSWASSSFQSCQSTVGTESVEKCLDIACSAKSDVEENKGGLRLDNIDEVQSVKSDWRDGQDAFENSSDLITPVTVIDALEFSSKNISDYISGGDTRITREIGKDERQIELDTMENEHLPHDQTSVFLSVPDILETDKTQGNGEVNKTETFDEKMPVTTVEKVNIESNTTPVRIVDTKNEFSVCKLLSFTGSLVQYDDSEDESDKEPSVMNDIVDSTSLEIVLKDSSDSSVLNGDTDFQKEKYCSVVDTNTCDHESILIDCASLCAEPLDTKYVTLVNTTCEATVSLCQEESSNSHASSELSPESSPVKKIKKKRVRKGCKMGPFLEKDLIQESKVRDWNSFIPKEHLLDSVSQFPIDETKIADEQPKLETVSVGIQCEPYYFSMVHRLNSTALSQEPVDLSDCDIVVLGVSEHCNSLEQLDNGDKEEYNGGVNRKSNAIDQSTMTDEALDADEIDLYILHKCFPMYSRKYLEDVMSVCGSNLDWVTNHLIDSPPIIDLNEEEETGEETQQSTGSLSWMKFKDSENLGNGGFDFGQTEKGENHNTYHHHAVQPLAHLARKVVEKIAEVDHDDLELQVIEAGQLRLQKIENFSRVRLQHSISFDNSLSERSTWLNDFRYNYFSGPLTPEECWEWNPGNQQECIVSDSMDKLFPLSPSSPTVSKNVLFSSSNSASLTPDSHKIAKEKTLMSDFSWARMSKKQVPYKKPSPFTFHPLPMNIHHQRVVSTPINFFQAEKIHQKQKPIVEVDIDNDIINQEGPSSSPVLPVSFIRSLEKLYGPLGLEIDHSGLYCFLILN